MSARLRLLAILLALALPLAGCVKKDGDAPAAPTSDVNETATPNATLPDGRGQSAGLLETNDTEEGVGGIEHRHDYWKGQDRVLLFDEPVGVFCPPCMPDGEDTQPRSVGYVKLGKLPGGDENESALVYEGAASVEVLLGTPTFDPVAESPGPPLAHPAAPALFLQWRSAADADWTERVPVTYDTPTIIEVEPEMTDMPHSVHSLWVFRLTTDRPDVLTVPMQVSVVKGRDVVDWPGHPEFYADNKTERVVMQQHVTTHMSGIESFALYDSGGTWATPEKLISWDTKEIRVYVNVTSSQNAYGATPTGYFLEVHNATAIGPEITFGSRHQDIHENNDLKSYEFAIQVDDVGMDGPYQPASRWGFRAMAVFATLPENPVANGLCPGCFPYDIEYDITVVALSYATGEADVMEPPV